jgi:hypothetical protein
MYRIVGEIKNIPAEQLAKSLERLYPNITYRPRVIGYDIELEEKNIELFISSYNEEEYNIDITFIAQKVELLDFLERLKKQLLALDVYFDLTYFEENEDGEQTSKDCLF